jgi:hypothetical protein
MQTDQSSVLEQMSCVELLEVIQLRHAIRDAEKAGLDGFAMSLRVTLARKLNAKRSRKLSAS